MTPNYNVIYNNNEISNVCIKIKHLISAFLRWELQHGYIHSIHNPRQRDPLVLYPDSSSDWTGTVLYIPYRICTDQVFSGNGPLTGGRCWDATDGKPDFLLPGLLCKYGQPGRGRQYCRCCHSHCAGRTGRYLLDVDRGRRGQRYRFCGKHPGPDL